MKSVIVYTSPLCTYCLRAKQLLQSLDIPFEEKDLSADPALAESLSTKHHWRTVPMIFIGEEFIGGYDDLSALNLSGELQKKLNG